MIGLYIRLCKPKDLQENLDSSVRIYTAKKLKEMIEMHALSVVPDQNQIDIMS